MGTWARVHELVQDPLTWPRTHKLLGGPPSRVSLALGQPMVFSPPDVLTNSAHVFPSGVENVCWGSGSVTTAPVAGALAADFAVFFLFVAGPSSPSWVACVLRRHWGITCEAQSWVLVNHVFCRLSPFPRDVTACLSRVESFRSKTPTHDSEARRRRTTPKQDVDARFRGKTPKQDALEAWRATESSIIFDRSFIIL
jgi:hypothetical protein